MLLLRGGKVVDVVRGTAEVRDFGITDSGLMAEVERPALAGERGLACSEGCYIIPGLIDAHVHLCRPILKTSTDDPTCRIAAAAKLALSAGVTLLRDMGDQWPVGIRVAATTDELPGPRVVSAISGLTTVGGYGAFLGEEVRDAADLVEAIKRRHQAGASCIKLFLSGGVDFSTGRVGKTLFDSETVSLAARTAHDLGLPLAVHANGAAAILLAVAAGVDTIEHGILIDRDGLQGMADNGTYWVPTLTPLWRLLQAEESKTTRIAGQRETLRDILARHKEAVATAFGLGIRVATGTDGGARGVPHGLLGEEMWLFEQAGVEMPLVLRSATIWAAEALGAGDETGLLEAGRRADFVILERNPLRDASALMKIKQVFCRGRLVELSGGR